MIPIKPYGFYASGSPLFVTAIFWHWKIEHTCLIGYANHVSSMKLPKWWIMWQEKDP